MSLFEKLMKIYPDLTSADFSPSTGTIVLQDDSDGQGVYIKSWDHPIHTQPTQDQLDAVQ